MSVDAEELLQFVNCGCKLVAKQDASPIDMAANEPIYIVLQFKNFKMADGQVLSSFVNCCQINPFDWDLVEVTRYKEEKCFI